MRDPAQIRAQVMIVLLGALALWLASTLTSSSRWLYIGVVIAVLIICEVIVLRFIPLQSKRDHQSKSNDG
jgi:bacteriorhodopsin